MLIFGSPRGAHIFLLYAANNYNSLFFDVSSFVWLSHSSVVVVALHLSEMSAISIGLRAEWPQTSNCARLIGVNMQLRYGGSPTTTITIKMPTIKTNKKVFRVFFFLSTSRTTSVGVCVCVANVFRFCLLPITVATARPVKMRAIIILNAIKNAFGRCPATTQTNRLLINNSICLYAYKCHYTYLLV